MSDRGYRRLLRSQSLPIALACTLASSLGGCATWADLGRLASLKDSSQASCRSDSWPTKVMGAVQRAEARAEISEDSYEPVAAESVVVALQPETPPLPVAKAPPAEPTREVIVHVPEPVAPSRPPPSPEVQAVCGATDTACQDQLAAMLADPLHKWIREKPTPHDERSGVRLLAYRVLTPVLACDDLRQGVREAEAITEGIESGAMQPGVTENGKSLVWVQLLGRAVKLELKAEIEKRC